MKPLHYGIVGVGGFGKTRRERLRKTGVFEIGGGVDVREEPFRNAEKEESQSLKRFASVEAMAAEPEIEAVLISTPANLHVAQAFVAVRAGKLAKKLQGKPQARANATTTLTYSLLGLYTCRAYQDKLWDEVHQVIRDGGIPGFRFL